MRKKWLINLSEEPNTLNATLYIGRSLRQIITGVSLFLAFQTIRKSQKYVFLAQFLNQRGYFESECEVKTSLPFWDKWEKSAFKALRN